MNQVKPLTDPAVPLAEDAAPNGAEPSLPGCPAKVSFPELVLAHHDWRKAVARGRPSGALERAYCAKLERFEEEHGRIVNAYWCLNVPSAVALTARPRPRLLRWLGFRPTHVFHRVTDWATRDRPAIAARLHECDELAIRAGQVLTGVRQRIALQRVMASATHLLSLADDRASRKQHREVLDEESRNLADCETYYRDAANGQTQMVYFAGMGVFALLLAGLAIPSSFLDPLPGIDNKEFFGALLAGALGAVVSVVARINSGRFDLEYDVGRAYPFFLGGLRPLMGAIFGVALYFAVSSGRLDVIPGSTTDDERFYAIVVIGFLAGFSERWAKDTLAVASGQRPAEEPAAKRTRSGAKDLSTEVEEEQLARKPQPSRASDPARIA
jgi:hypothetical protein